MARMRVFIVLVLALTAGGALAFGTYNYMQKAAPGQTVTIPTERVVVAGADLDLGDTLTADAVRVIDWPPTPRRRARSTTRRRSSGAGWSCR